MSDLLEIYTLGGLSLKLGGESLTGFASRKAEALLVYVAYQQREFPREVLADLLWDDRSQVQAMSNLRVILTELRQHLAPYVIITRQTVRFNPSAVYRLDVAEFESGVRAVEGQLTQHGELSVSTSEKLEKAVNYYRGDFLAGFHIRDSQGFEEWASLERERLGQCVIEALHELVRYSVRRRAYAAGITYATRLLQLDPLHEQTYQDLMLMLARTGQRAAALAQYETCQRLLSDELGIEPGEELQALYRQIQAGSAASSRPSSGSPRHLPPALTPFVGRTDELLQIAAYLDDPACRLLTLIGPGGIGKTRLALQVVSQREDFADGIFFIPLASVTSPVLLVSVIGETLKIAFNALDDLQAQLFNDLCTKDLLLVFDNFEHILDAAELLGQILAVAPRVKILVTSRERLNLQEEWLMPIEGMAYPQETLLEGGDTFGAVALFAQSARRVQPGFSLDANLAEVVQICRLVEGMPLGIELAAAWVRTIPVREIARKIEHNLDFLATSLRNVPARHRSLRALFEHSWELLSPEERQAFMRLAIFSGGFTADTAENVASCSFGVLTALIEKSLVRPIQEARYVLHEVVRQYAHEQLRQVAESEQLHNQYLAFFVALAEEAATELRGLKQAQWLDRLENEHESFRGALSWALQSGNSEAALRLGAALWRFWSTRGYITEGRHWLDQTLTIAGEDGTALHARALYGAGVLAWSQGDHAQATVFHQKSLAVRCALNDELGKAEALNGLGLVAWSQGDYALACMRYEESLGIRIRIGFKLGIASTLNNLGLAILDQGDYARAHMLYEECLSLERELEDQQGIAAALISRGMLAYEQNDLNFARISLEESLAIYQKLGHKPGLARAFNSLGILASRLGNYKQAYDCFQESLLLRRELGDKVGASDVLSRLTALQHSDSQAEGTE